MINDIFMINTLVFFIYSKPENKKASIYFKIRNCYIKKNNNNYDKL